MKRGQKTISFSEFVALIALTMALVAFAINMILPALQQIGKDLALGDPNDVQLIVSLLYLGLAIGQLLFGPLSDSIGRKPSMLFGLIVFATGCLISICAESFGVLLSGQLIQGIGLGAPRIVTVAIVRDNFVGREMARVMSFIMVVFIFVPTVSPALGQAIMFNASWTAIYALLLGLTLLMLIWFHLRLAESLPRSQRTALSLARLIKELRELCNSPRAIGYTVLSGLISSAFIAYLNLSQQIFQVQYQLGAQYPFYFAILSLGLGAASLLNGRIVLRFGMTRLTKWALFTSGGVSTIFCCVAYLFLGHPPFWMLMLVMMILLFCFGILVGNLNALAMEPLGHIAGIGAAFVGSLSTFISVPVAILIGKCYDNSVLPLIVGFAICSAFSLVVFYWVNGKKRRPLEVINNSPHRPTEISISSDSKVP